MHLLYASSASCKSFNLHFLNTYFTSLLRAQLSRPSRVRCYVHVRDSTPTCGGFSIVDAEACDKFSAQLIQILGKVATGAASGTLSRGRGQQDLPHQSFMGHSVHEAESS